MSSGEKLSFFWITRLIPTFYTTFLLALGYFDTYKDVGEWTEAITPCLQVCAGEKTDETISECISNVASQIASGLGLDTDSLLRSHLQNGDSETEDSGLPEPPTVDEIATAEHIADATYDEKCAAYDKFFEVPGGGEGIKIRFNNGIPQEAGATFDKTDPSRRECPPSHPKRIFESHEGNGKSCETVPATWRSHIKSCDLVKDPNTDYTERDAGQNLFHHLCYQDDDDESGWPIIRDPKKRNCPKDYPTFWLSPPPATPHPTLAPLRLPVFAARLLTRWSTACEKVYPVMAMAYRSTLILSSR